MLDLHEGILQEFVERACRDVHSLPPAVTMHLSRKSGQHDPLKKRLYNKAYNARPENKEKHKIYLRTWKKKS